MWKQTNINTATSIISQVVEMAWNIYESNGEGYFVVVFSVIETKYSWYNKQMSVYKR